MNKTIKEQLNELDSFEASDESAGPKINWLQIRDGKFVYRGYDEQGDQTLIEVGETFEGSIVRSTKSLTAFPEYDPMTKINKPLLSTEPVTSGNHFSLCRINKTVKRHSDWWNDYPDAKTEFSLLVIPKDDTTKKYIVPVRGFSLSPNNENALFGHFVHMRKKHESTSLGWTKFTIKTSEYNGRSFNYVGFDVGEAVPEELHQQIVDLAKSEHDKYEKKQSDHEARADLKDHADKSGETISEPPTGINPDDIPF